MIGYISLTGTKSLVEPIIYFIIYLISWLICGLDGCFSCWFGVLVGHLLFLLTDYITERTLGFTLEPYLQDTERPDRSTIIRQHLNILGELRRTLRINLLFGSFRVPETVLSGLNLSPQVVQRLSQVQPDAEAVRRVDYRRDLTMEYLRIALIEGEIPAQKLKDMTTDTYRQYREQMAKTENRVRHVIRSLARERIRLLVSTATEQYPDLDLRRDGHDQDRIFDRWLSQTREL